MTLPNLIWIVIDRSLWTSDAALYGVSALRVHHALVNGDAGWWREMMAVSPKPPLLPWLGQFFVPVGQAIGSIDAGLLLVPFLAQVATLAAVYRTHLEYFHERSIALIGALAIAAAPLFVDVTRQFYAQSLQLAAVAWFVYIMARARTWDAVFIGLHLTAAAAFTMLVIVSSPLYVIVPVAVSISHIWKTRLARPAWTAGHTAMLILALSLVFVAGSWYARNAGAAIAYADWAFQYRYAGITDGFLTKLSIWALRTLAGFIWPALLVPLALAVLLARFARRRRPDAPHPPAWLLPAILAQVTLVLLMLSTSAQQTSRYLLPLAPYLTLVMGWIVFHLRARAARLAIAALLIVQLASVHMRTFTVLQRDGDVAPAGASAMGARARQIVDAIAGVTSGSPPGALIFATGTLGLYNLQWEYEAAKRPPYLEQYFSGQARQADSVEFMLTGSSADGRTGRDLREVWTTIEAKAAFVVLAAPQTREVVLEQRQSRSAPGDAGWLQILQGGSDVARRLEASHLFEPIELPEYPEIVVFRRTRGDVR